MKRLRGRITYANVMSTIAVFLVLGGGAAFAAGQLGKNTVGPKQLKKNAVTAAKIKKGAVTTAKLSGATVTALKGATGPQGEPGTALAFATLTENGAIVQAQSKNMGGAKVSNPEGGLYCFSGLPFSPKIAVASPQFFEPDPFTIAVIVGQSANEELYECPIGTQVAVQTEEIGAGGENSPFRIFFN